MEGLVEQLVVKKKTMKDTFIQVGIIIAGFILVFVAFNSL